MPCLFLENVPKTVRWKKTQLKKLHEEIEKISGAPIEIHRLNVEYSLLTPEGELPAPGHGIHGWVFWHKGRKKKQKAAIGELLQAFFDAHNIGAGFDLTFVDLPRKKSFYVNGKLVE